ncbi:hypothetical protein [Methylobacterium sp. NFXW15]|uniref:hypothetical protein n=1 Tax=Methylobacterium sp. NFXW15 TaxID=2819512 RepID=UPI003CF6F372
MTTASPKSARTRTAKSKFGGVAVVCTKCAKRQGLPAKAIRKLLKDAHATLRPEGDGAKGKRRKLFIVESGCLGPCPKRAVAIGTAASLASGRVLLLDPDGGAEAARAALLPEFGPIAGLAAERDTPGAVDETAPPR